MTFKWPKKINIGIDDMEVRYLNREKMDIACDVEEGTTFYGLCFLDKNRILICTENPISWLDDDDVVFTRSPSAAFKTLVHEFVHKVCHEYGLSTPDPELLCNVFATEITKFFQACGVEFPPIGVKKKKKVKKNV